MLTNARSAHSITILVLLAALPLDINCSYFEMSYFCNIYCKEREKDWLTLFTRKIYVNSVNNSSKCLRGVAIQVLIPKTQWYDMTAESIISVALNCSMKRIVHFSILFTIWKKQGTTSKDSCIKLEIVNYRAIFNLI